MSDTTSPPENYFQSPGTLLRRARQHIGDLETGLQTFMGANPYVYVVDPDPETEKDMHKIQFTAPIPDDISAIARDAISCLRDALDHIVYASTVAINGGQPKYTKFPFGDTATAFEGDIKGRCKDVPPEVVELLRSFRPYQGGDDLLWAFNKLRNIKGHRCLLPAAIITSGITISGGRFHGTGIRLNSPCLNSDKKEIIYMETNHGALFDYNIDVSVFIALADVEIIRNGPATDALKFIHNKIALIGQAVEAETLRILALPTAG